MDESEVEMRLRKETRAKALQGPAEPQTGEGS